VTVTSISYIREAKIFGALSNCLMNLEVMVPLAGIALFADMDLYIAYHK
jgi:hypothetical protein